MNQRAVETVTTVVILVLVGIVAGLLAWGSAGR